MNKHNRIRGFGALSSLIAALVLFGATPAVADLQLMPANIEVFGSVESIDSIKGIVKVRGQSYRFAPKIRIHKMDGTVVNRLNMRLKKGMIIAIRHTAKSGSKTYIAEEIWVKKNDKK